MNAVSRKLGKILARYLSKHLPGYERLDSSDPTRWRHELQPGDLILVEGDTRFSKIVKYLTQSTWSHIAMFIGDADPEHPEHELIEADVNDGVITVPLSKYRNFNVRICRPVGLSPDAQQQVVQYMLDRKGYTYDLKNILDLMRYFLPKPPFFSRNRRRYLEIGSGDPTRAICSSLIAQAFQSIKYPILPRRGFHCVEGPGDVSDEEIMRQRHYSLFAPRDFDLSPYFKVIKPSLDDFDYTSMKWMEDHNQREKHHQATPPPEAVGVGADAGTR